MQICCQQAREWASEASKQAWRRKLTNTKAMAYPNSAPNSSLQILDAHSPYLTHLISRSRSMWRPAIVRGGKPLWGSCGVALRGLPRKGLGFKVCCCINSFMAGNNVRFDFSKKNYTGVLWGSQQRTRLCTWWLPPMRLVAPCAALMTPLIPGMSAVPRSLLNNDSSHLGTWKTT
jgi:hypothetical protein